MVSFGAQGSTRDKTPIDIRFFGRAVRTADVREITGKCIVGLLIPLISHSSNLNELWCWKSPRVSEDPPSDSIHNSSLLHQTTACGLIMI